MDTTTARTYAFGVIGAEPVDDATASSPGLADGVATRQMIDSLETMRDVLLLVDETHPDLGIREELGRLGDLVLAQNLTSFADGFTALMERAKPFMPS